MIDIEQLRAAVQSINKGPSLFQAQRGHDFVRKHAKEIARAYLDLHEQNRKLREALEFVQSKITWELNPSNYDHQEVCDMNADWCEIGNAVDAALAEGATE